MSSDITSNNKRERLHYIDAMRGFAIFLVVYSHIVFHSFHLENTLNDMISTIHMPLFFFISGYVLRKWKLDSYIAYFKLLGNKVITFLLLPTIIGLVYAHILRDSGIIAYATNEMKYGYWFTISLFEMYFILLTITVLINKATQIIYRKETIIGIVGIVSILLWLGIYLCADLDWYRFLVKTICIHQTSLYLPFFCLGILMQIKSNEWSCHYNSKSLIIFSLIFISLTLLNITNSDRLNLMFPTLPIRGLLLLLIGFSGTISVFILFYKYRYYMSEKKIVGRLLMLWGVNSLTIYLLHYFILPFLRPIKDFVGLEGNIITVFLAGFICTILIISICCFIKRFIISRFFKFELKRIVDTK